MGKPSKNRNLPDNCAMALDRSIRSSAQKLNLVAESIRGMDASKALIQLEFSKKRIATDVKKVLQSAIANAENNHNLDVDELIVAHAYVGKNMVLKSMVLKIRCLKTKLFDPFDLQLEFQELQKPPNLSLIHI